MAKNPFMHKLDSDLNNVFYDISRFGVVVTYKAGGTGAGVEIRGIFDTELYTGDIDGSDSEVFDSRLNVRVREVDVTSPKKTDTYTIDGKTYKTAEFWKTKTGELIVVLYE